MAIRYTLIAWLASGCGLGVPGAQEREHVMEGAVLILAAHLTMPAATLAAQAVSVESEAPRDPDLYTCVSQPYGSSALCLTMSMKRRWIRSVISPALPDPTGMWSTLVMGVTSEAVPEKKSSSQV